MGKFHYQSGTLHAENVALSTIAQTIPTPFYCYSATAIKEHFSAYQAAFADEPSVLIAYALKANSNQAILTLLGAQGAGADVVSGGELRRALAAHIPPNKIVYSGVGKTKDEIDFALAQNIHCFNVESLPELEHIAVRAKALGKKAPISLRINPDIDANTHQKITTGKAENKFGLPLNQALNAYKNAQSSPYLTIKGIDIHIGSQICTLAPFAKAFTLVAQFIQTLAQEGIFLRHVDLGGGLGIAYNPQEMPPTLADYAALVKKSISPLGLQIILEPGRNIVGNAGVLVTTLLYIKEAKKRNFLIIDAAMNDLIRPTLYEAWQNIIPVKEPKASPSTTCVDIVGPICETGDYLGKDRYLPPVAPGEMLAITGAGAYGAVMASTYNSRLLVPEILVQNQIWDIVRPRLNYTDLLALDHVPAWLLGK
ncbi:diaminopimelate decarboxylase [Bartonella sp. DGB2]|uniref:diaminopimelate decarboxylase n=1 Tax=Bartonella sp. DGB2 TaxID=3388426 RepID=UPI003990180F